jgi:hypothetical protein
MIRVESLRNPKNCSQDKTISFIKEKEKTLRIKIKGSF